MLQQNVPVTHCALCRSALIPGDRVRVAHILNKDLRHSSPFVEVKETLATGDFELVHTNCENPMRDLNQHVGLDTCSQCRKVIKPGERVSVAFIVEAIEPNPAIPFSGLAARLSGNQGELVHISCHDPMLLGMRIVT